MATIHISSEDVQSGTTFDGIFNLNIAISGNLKVLSHYVEDGLIPWIYQGCELIQITRTSDSSNHTVIFSQVDSDDPAVVQAAIEAAFDAISFLVGTIALFDAANNEYDVTVSEGITLRWSSSSSTAQHVFNKKLSGDEVSVGTFSLSGRHIDSRPKYLEVIVKESQTSNSASRGNPGDFVISTFDEEVRGSLLSLSSIHTSISINFRRVNVPNASVPFLLKWDLIFV